MVGRQNSVFTEKHNKLGGVGGSPSGPTGFKQATFDLIRTHVCQLGAVSARRVPSIRPSASGVSGASSGTPPLPPIMPSSLCPGGSLLGVSGQRTRANICVARWGTTPPPLPPRYTQPPPPSPFGGLCSSFVSLMWFNCVALALCLKSPSVAHSA